MTGYIAINALLCLLILTAVAMVLCRGTRRAVLAYVVQAVVLCGILLILAEALESEGLLMRSGTTFVFKALVIPAVILFAFKKAGEGHEVAEPVIGATAFLLVCAAELAACFCIVAAVAPASMAAVAPVLAIALGLFLMGLSAIVAHRDIFRQILGYLLMEAGSHLMLALLAPTVPELAEACVTLVSVLAVSAMCVFAVYVRRVTYTLDTDQLHELKG